MSKKASSSIVSQIIGHTTFTWDELDPLAFTAVTQYDPDEPAYTQEFDLNALDRAFERTFLLAVRDLIMRRHLKIKRITINGEYKGVVRLLKRIQTDQVSADKSMRMMASDKISVIDTGLMIAITMKLVNDPKWVNAYNITRLREWFTFAGEGPVFRGLELASFPAADTSGVEDATRQNIVALAMSRSAQVAVLLELERLFQVGEIPLSAYVLWNLTNYIYARPESLRQIRCGDVTFDQRGSAGEIKYVLWLMPAKRGGVQPERMPYPLPSFLGQLLFRQQKWVIENVGPLYGLTGGLDQLQKDSIEKRIALFPRINDGTPKPFELENFGMLESGGVLRDIYLSLINRALKEAHVSFNAMRHTIGTQLAAAGVSVAVIQAVLRHADDKTARRYIDLAAKELREALSSGLEVLEQFFPAFGAFMDAKQAHAVAQVNPERVIVIHRSPDVVTGLVETQIPGVCGRLEACGYAPLSCYPCFLWIPNIDADHSVNLEIVQQRIAANQALGKSMRTIVERDQILAKSIELRMGQFEKFKAEREMLRVKQSQVAN